MPVEESGSPHGDPPDVGGGTAFNRSRNLVGATIGRYQILEELGGGGMGIVYRAHDTRLNRTVALKFLPQFLSHDSQARSRFFAEARAASALDHGNVCTVHEIGETDDGQIFIAMSAYQGETLKPKIQRGPLPVDQALDYAVQTARGLAKAHAKGIIHRDIKPANLMVTDDGVVKILDFGTAKTRDFALTQTGTSVGTIGYMSPEQAEGEAIDARSDLWALGAVLYEMLSGSQPFKGDRAVAVVYSILCEEPKPLTEFDPDIPPTVIAIVERCLTKDPEERYGSAAELIADLEAAAQRSGAQLTPSPPGTRLHLAKAAGRWNWNRISGAAVGIALLIVLARASGLIGSDTPASTPAAARQYIAVLPFEATDARDGVLAAGLARSLTSMVARLEAVADSVWVVPTSAIESLDEPTPGEIRRLYPVTGVITGLVERTAQATRVTLQLEGGDPNAPRLLGSASVPGPPDTGFQAAIQDALVEVLRLSDNPAAQLAVRRETAASPTAYPFYLQGVGYLRRIYDEGSRDNAISLFEQALAEDANYAPALAGLCEAIWDQFVRSQQVGLARDAIAYCDRAAELNNDEPIALTSLASIYLQTGEVQKADDAIRRALALDPEYAAAHRWLGRVHEYRGETEEALNAYGQAIALRPDVWLYHEEAGVALSLVDRHQEAAGYFEQMIRLSPDNYRGYSNLAVVRRHLGAVAQAEELYGRSIELRPSALAYRNLGRLNQFRGSLDSALVYFNRALELQPDDWRALSWIGETQLLLGNAADGAEALDTAIGLLGPLLDVTPNDVDMLTHLAVMHALQNRDGDARMYLERVAALPDRRNYVAHWSGRAYELIGDREQAFAHVGTALRGGYNPAIIAADPWLADLRGDPRYEAVIQTR